MNNIKFQLYRLVIKQETSVTSKGLYEGQYACVSQVDPNVLFESTALSMLKIPMIKGAVFDEPRVFMYSFQDNKWEYAGQRDEQYLLDKGYSPYSGDPVEIWEARKGPNFGDTRWTDFYKSLKGMWQFVVEIARKEIKVSEGDLDELEREHVKFLKEISEIRDELFGKEKQQKKEEAKRSLLVEGEDFIPIAGDIMED